MRTITKESEMKANMATSATQFRTIETTQDITDTFWTLVETGMRFMDAKQTMLRAVKAEGTPAIVDTCEGFFRALDEAMEAHIQIQNVAAEELQKLRGLADGAVQS